LSGNSEHDVEIRFTGLREGENLKEELFYKHEDVIPTSCEKIKRTSGKIKDWSRLCSQLDELRASMNVDGAAPIRAKIKEIVPGYSYLENPQSSDVGNVLVERRVKKASASD